MRQGASSGSLLRVAGGSSVRFRYNAKVLRNEDIAVNIEFIVLFTALTADNSFPSRACGALGWRPFRPLDHSGEWFACRGISLAEAEASARGAVAVLSPEPDWLVRLGGDAGETGWCGASIGSLS